MSCFFKKVYQADSPMCIETRAGYCASRLNRYWDWNDAVLAKPKPAVSPTGELYEMELAKSLDFPMERFERCLKDKSAFDYAQNIYTESLRKGVRVTPLYTVEDKLLNLRELVELIGQRF
jgi:protein-disulfide isomerase